METRSREPHCVASRAERVEAATDALQFRRAQIQLGTVVSISIGGMVGTECIEVARRGFAAISAIHQLMSFHEPGSDVDRLNRRAHREFVEIHPLTAHVLSRALDIAAASDGAFDITIAAELVARGLLPHPHTNLEPDIGRSWRDIEISANRVRFHRPLWIDLGGIAKGFAVDHAFEAMAVSDDVQLCVNAGGDLRIHGEGEHRVRLRVPPGHDQVPVLVIHDGISVASSSGTNGDGAHIHGVRRTVMGECSFVTVMSEQCMIADALTKVVMAMNSGSHRVLHKFGARALLFEDGCVATFGATA